MNSPLNLIPVNIKENEDLPFIIIIWKLKLIKPIRFTTSLARGTRPSTEAITDHERVDMFSTTLSDAPAVIYQVAAQSVSTNTNKQKAKVEKRESPRKNE